MGLLTRDLYSCTCTSLWVHNLRTIDETWRKNVVRHFQELVSSKIFCTSLECLLAIRASKPRMNMTGNYCHLHYLISSLRFRFMLYVSFSQQQNDILTENDFLRHKKFSVCYQMLFLLQNNYSLLQNYYLCYEISFFCYKMIILCDELFLVCYKMIFISNQMISFVT